MKTAPEPGSRIQHGGWGLAWKAMGPRLLELKGRLLFKPRAHLGIAGQQFPSRQALEGLSGVQGPQL